ncbi:CD209 antigen-like protein A [Mercenaria mercenaria]|uniref:CD209 antigen-like protein A n=1 Tax=Mercenaria mercenaria TaxID=6596 RepID=UPI00234F23D2|nr:CD209 antigen-like protein A [Mercenaria mercenaria]
MKFLGVILIMLQVYFSNGEEAHCSRYHYEEQTLAKIVRMEHRLEELEKRRDADLTNRHCPDGWVTFQGSCYLFSQADVSFFDAEVLCSQTGGHLVRVESEVENNFVKHYLKQLKSKKLLNYLISENTDIQSNLSTKCTFSAISFRAGIH